MASASGAAAAGSARADATAIGGLVQPRGNRHMGFAYTVIDGAADADATYTYWLEAQTQAGEMLSVATLNAPPPTIVWLPVVKR